MLFLTVIFFIFAFIFGLFAYSDVVVVFSDFATILFVAFVIASLLSLILYFTQKGNKRFKFKNFYMEDSH